MSIREKIEVLAKEWESLDEWWDLSSNAAARLRSLLTDYSPAPAAHLCPMNHGAEHDMEPTWFCETCGYRIPMDEPATDGGLREALSACVPCLEDWIATTGFGAINKRDRDALALVKAALFDHAAHRDQTEALALASPARTEGLREMAELFFDVMRKHVQDCECHLCKKADKLIQVALSPKKDLGICRCMCHYEHVGGCEKCAGSHINKKPAQEPVCLCTEDENGPHFNGCPLHGDEDHVPPSLAILTSPARTEGHESYFCETCSEPVMCQLSDGILRHWHKDERWCGPVRGIAAHPQQQGETKPATPQDVITTNTKAYKDGTITPARYARATDGGFGEVDIREILDRYDVEYCQNDIVKDLLAITSQLQPVANGLQSESNLVANQTDTDQLTQQIPENQGMLGNPFPAPDKKRFVCKNCKRTFDADDLSLAKIATVGGHIIQMGDGEQVHYSEGMDSVCGPVVEVSDKEEDR
jgi:hypothetical protein